MKKKICIIFSTRPEIIKLYPIIKLLNSKKKKFFCINTGQHYDYEMHEIFMNEFKLKNKIYNFRIKLKKQITFFSKSLLFIEKILKKEKPTHVIVQGDTNTGLVGSLCCSIINREIKKKIKIIHIEAGLRSFDENMPEEINRKIIDLLSNYLLVPTNIDYKNLLNENLVSNKNVYVSGNTIVDSLDFILKKNKRYILQNQLEKYFLLTLHRPETVDDINRFKTLLKNLNFIGLNKGIKFIFPIHPRSSKKLSKLFIKKLNNINIIKPVKYTKFIKLLYNCEIVFTDSGGIQEEAFILNKPCITIRKSTERQITTLRGSNLIVGYDYKKINYATNKLLKSKIWNYKHFGKVGLSKKIIKYIL